MSVTTEKGSERWWQVFYALSPGMVAGADSIDEWRC